MSFIADKQTLDDLNLLGKYKPNSIYGLFNKVQTNGGEKLLEAMFRHPLSDPEEINARSGVFQYFERGAWTFPFTKEQIVVLEEYLGGGSSGGSGGHGGGNILSTAMGVLQKKLSDTLMGGKAYGLLYTSVTTVIAVLKKLYVFLDKLEKEARDNPYADQGRRLKEILGERRLAGASFGPPLSFRQVAAYDHLFRHTLREKLDQVIQGIYQLDVYIAVGGVSRERAFNYARALPKENHTLNAIALSHPGIHKAVPNPLSLDRESNMLFLTGANMAGKSTFMKAFGISVYMAHMGFPVAAEKMVFSVMDGIYSSINVPDNLHLGYSHFYAEVLRVKKVAETVNEGKNVVVIFDELFKGTNVKDAYDATLAVTEAFAAYRNCFFIISTHIVEAGETLKERLDNLRFLYLPTIMEGTSLRYTYRLEEGISTDRHGMTIIREERILEIIHS